MPLSTIFQLYHVVHTKFGINIFIVSNDDIDVNYMQMTHNPHPIKLKKRKKKNNNWKLVKNHSFMEIKLKYLINAINFFFFFFASFSRYPLFLSKKIPVTRHPVILTLLLLTEQIPISVTKQ